MKRPNLDAIERRAAKVPGKTWVRWVGTSRVFTGPIQTNEPGQIWGARGGGVAICEIDPEEWRDPVAIADFIAHSRSDMVRLVAYVRHLEATIARRP